MNSGYIKYSVTWPFKKIRYYIGKFYNKLIFGDFHKFTLNVIHFSSSLSALFDLRTSKKAGIFSNYSRLLLVLTGRGNVWDIRERFL